MISKFNRFDARPETAADERLDHADARGIHLQALREHEMQVIADLRHGLHREAARQRIELGKAGVRLDLRVVDLGATELLLAHQIGRGKTLRDVAELMMDVAFEVAGFVVVQKHGIRRARSLGRIIGGELRHFQFDQAESPLGGLRVDRGHRRDRLAAIAHAAARQRIFVHGDREHAVSVGTIIAGNDCPDAFEGARF